MEWIKDYTDSDHHPQMLAAGFWGRAVFHGLCRLSGRFNWRGHIPQKYLAGAYLVGYFGFPIQPTEAEAAVSALLTHGLLAEEPAGVVIDGWERRQPSESLSAERSRRWRHKRNGGERKRTQANAPAMTPSVDLDLDRDLDLKSKDSSSRLDMAASVFAYWAQKLDHPRAKLDPKRRKLIAARLGEGSSEEELRLAVDGVLVDMATWPDRRRFDGVEYVFESRGSVEKFADLAVKGAPMAQRDVTTGFQPSDDWSKIPFTKAE